MTHTIALVNINTLVNGDTVEHEGEPRTVSNQNYKYDPFMGWCLYGDSYHSGYKPVKKVIVRR